jgi:hypothetical protein
MTMFGESSELFVEEPRPSLKAGWRTEADDDPGG